MCVWMEECVERWVEPTSIIEREVNWWGDDDDDDDGEQQRAARTNRSYYSWMEEEENNIMVEGHSRKICAIEMRAAQQSFKGREGGRY